MARQKCSLNKTKMNYEAYKGPVGEMKVESSFGKIEELVNFKVSKLQHVVLESLRTSDRSSSQAIARTLKFHENDSVSAETRKNKNSENI